MGRFGVSVYVLLFISQGKLSNWDEKKRKGDANWELHQTSLFSNPIRLLNDLIDEFLLLIYTYWNNGQVKIKQNHQLAQVEVKTNSKWREGLLKK